LDLSVVSPAQKPDYGPLKRQIQGFVAHRLYGICFKDIRSGAVFGFNEDRPMVAASTTKVPVVLYLYHLVAEGKVKWSDTVTYNGGSDFESGAGVLEFTARPGDKYSLRTLATLAITTSDNVACRMLIRHLGQANVCQYMAQLGGKAVFPGGRNLTTAADLVRYMEAVLEFARKHRDPGSRLLDDMANSVYHIGLPGQLPEEMTIPHKEGQIGDVANDFGVIYSPRPFILAVLSSGNESVEEGFAGIAAITRMGYEYQQKVERGEQEPD
jgi:beta-lactamase class A